MCFLQFSVFFFFIMMFWKEMSLSPVCSPGLLILFGSHCIYGGPILFVVGGSKGRYEFWTMVRPL